MAEATTAPRPLIALALPEKGAARLLAQAGLAILGTLLLTLSAKISVPFWPVPMTLQTFVVLLIGAGFGMRLGVATLLLYLAEGAVGLPVFQGTPEKGIGYAYMLSYTGGFLAGFVVMAAIAGWATDNGWGRNIVKLLGAMLVAEIVMMAMGFGWLAGLIGIEKAWIGGVLPFIVPDLVKVALAAVAYPAAVSLVSGRS